MYNAEEWICDNPDHIAEMIEHWVPQLGIADWAIKLAVRKQIDIHKQGVAASHWLLSRRQGWVTLSRSDSRPSSAEADDAEMSLVHELLHIVFAAWHDHSEATLSTGSVVYDVCCEQPIDQLTETLVLLRRSTGHKFSFEQKDQIDEDIQSR